MTVTWTDAIVFAFAWSCIWGSLLVSHVLDWKFEWMQPKLWFLYVKRNLAHSKEIFFKCSELPNKIHKPFEDLINVFETGNLQSPDLRMDQSFRRKFEHEIHLLKKNNIRREMRMAYLKLPEEYIKKNDFKHWSDAGREWREVVLQGTILNRYLDKKTIESFTKIFLLMVRSCSDNPGISATMRSAAKTEMMSRFFIHSIRTSSVQAVGPLSH